MKTLSLYKVRILEEHVYFEEAATPKEAMLHAQLHRQNNTVGDHGAWRQEKKVTAKKLS